VVLSLMMKLAGGTLFQRDQMNAREFLKQADLYQEVDANLLDRMYKLLMVSAVNHPLIIVRARESVDWTESQQYKDILAGHYPRVPLFGSNGGSNGNSRNGNGRRAEAGPTASPPTSPPTSEPQLIRCPHCDREQTNQRFCSFCGGTIE
jgi:hypothetical protein